ncbi:FAD-dependent oxidoreductase [Thalassospira sp. TSL5-1]|uniref:flavin monoamine oxidase family protein n=1 Tax=Thalassospira sp. TSL5-1 TaxID=1544451 RepID=UPI00095D146D|nr:FAD-dependent oxidoreductase [Thalassospira sp. TSL5-1]OKH88931.1 amine oxidase [Thalassospira sp. TSL5-1]
MSKSQHTYSRRTILKGLTALAGAYAAPSLLTGFRNAQAAYPTTMPDLPPGFGKGKSVAIIGAGVAGLTAAYRLANAGFKVAVFEADSRYGGRSLTARPSDTHYKDWWFKNHKDAHLFPAMYADRYQERRESPAPEVQTCSFMDNKWQKAGYQGDPVELFLNAGPGRIPSNHVNLIALCQEIGVDLETYIFQSMSNLMQSPTYNNGNPAAIGDVTYNLYGEMAEMMYGAIREGCMLQGKSLSDADKKQLENLARLFGDLDKAGRFNGSPRSGYDKMPGGWRDGGKRRAQISLDDILKSQFIGDADANPELSPGSFLFNSFNIDWQPTLMQPIGGMDRIWQQLLLQKIPASAIDSRVNGNRENASSDPRVGDLVSLNSPTQDIIVREDSIQVRYTPKNEKNWIGVKFDFCISTMAPSLLQKVLDYPAAPRPFIRGLQAFSETGSWGNSDPTPNLWTPAIKVGWQGMERFWETEDEIYGGISWTTNKIGQIWYPSEDFTAHTGILTGAYNRGENAAEYAQMNNQQRLDTARKGLALLHPGNEDKVGHGMSIAWQYMPHQVGGWASDTATETPDVYKQITTFAKNSRFYCAGDTWSYLPGWQEGSVASAYCAINAIAHAMDPANNAFAVSACFTGSN